MGVFLLTNCGGGGGGSSSASNTSASGTSEDAASNEDAGSSSAGPTNTPPVAVIKDVTAVIEGMSVDLNATLSYDIDGDTLSYEWVQLSGEQVTLINPKTATPSFVAPEVTSDSSVTLQLSLSDGVVTSKSQKVIFIVNQERVVKSHEVMPTVSTLKTTNGVVEINYTYNRSEITSGLALNIYWDSSKLEFLEIKDALQNDYMGISTMKEDIDNSDSNEKTDSYITLSWVNLEDGIWTVPTPLPTQLFTLNMKSKDIIGTTAVNIGTKFDSPLVSFYTKSVIVQLEE